MNDTPYMQVSMIIVFVLYAHMYKQILYVYMAIFLLHSNAQISNCIDVLVTFLATFLVHKIYWYLIISNHLPYLAVKGSCNEQPPYTRVSMRIVQKVYI